jgi:hypothetical protein
MPRVRSARFVAHFGEDWRLSSGFVHQAGLGKVHEGQQFVPVVLIVRYPGSETLLDILVDDFGLAIGLRMMGCGEFEFRTEDTTELLPKGRDVLRASVRDDGVGRSPNGVDMTEEKCYSSNRRASLLGQLRR